ncbi:MAG: low molecular weight phosphotyrosine protein phosphatase [Flavobacteriaceae bacterium]|nr:low molecular weight phosphotyrosine protein phosphatase [Flavobacteriaceae bacterium]
MKKILFVCLGNICRSPLAEALFNQLANDKGLDIRADSCGTANYHVGENPDPRTIAVAEKHNIPMSHKGRQLKAVDFENYDHILVMDQANLQDTLSVYQKSGAPSAPTIELLRNHDSQGQGNDVADPWFGNADDFEECYQTVLRCCDALHKIL